MARQVLPVVGAIVGAYFGNPQLGWAIGSAIGNAVDPQVIKGPSIGELAQQTSSEGGPRPWVFGLSPPIAGNVIATGEPRIVKRKKSSGKGGPKVETESVYRTYAVGVSETVGGFVRVWRNSQLVYDVSADSQVSAEDNLLFLEHARFFLGTFDQEPSPDLEALFGVGTTPAHRGTAYMVMADEDLTDFRGAIPQWTFQVQRCGVQTPMIVALSNTGFDPTHQVMRSLDGTNFELQETPENPNSPLNGFAWSGMAHSRELGLFVAVQPVTQHIMYSENAEDWTLHDAGVGAGWRDITWSGTLGLFVMTRGTITGQAIATSPDALTWTLRNTPASFVSGQVVHWTGERLIAGQNGSIVANLMSSEDGITWTNIAGTPSIAVYDMNSYAIDAVRTVDRALQNWKSVDGGVTFSSSGSGVGFGLGDLAFDPNGKVVAVSIFGMAAAAAPLANLTAISAPAGQWEGICYSTSFGGFYMSCGPGSGTSRIAYMADGANTVVDVPVPANCQNGGWDFVLAVDSSFTGDCSMSVAEIIDELCERVGMPAGTFDTSELLDDLCPGLAVTNAYPASEAIRALSQVFFFDPSNSDGVLHFPKRGANSVATITEDELVDSDAELEREKRSDPIIIPRVLHLMYHDVAGGLAPNKQTSERAGDRRALGEQTLQSAIVLHADQAARAVVINHKIMAESQGGELKYQLPDSFLELAPADPIILQWQGHSVRVMIQRADTFDGYQEYLAVRDRQSAYVSTIEGIPPPPSTPPPSSQIGATLLELLDIHILRDADDAVGLFYYVAVSGILDAWQGAEVEISYDGGANYVDSDSTTVPALMGSLLSALPDHPQAYPDETNTVRVQILSPNEDLFATTLAGMLNRENLVIIGDEIIQFAEADEVYEGVWDLSYLLRGRKGTTTAAHIVGERFVFLDRDSLTMVPANLVDVGRTLTFRATSFGTNPENGTVKSMTYAGRAQIEREVGYLEAHRDGTDAVVTWQGVGRLGAGAQVAHGQRFDGYRVTFDDGSNPEIVVDTDDETVTQDVSGLGSPINITVVQLNSLTGEGPPTEVVLL